MTIKHAGLALVVIAAWLAIALAAMLPGTIATAAVPIGTKLPDAVAVIGATKHLLILRSDDPRYVRELYKSGALFVLPARQKTCLSVKAS